MGWRIYNDIKIRKEKMNKFLNIFRTFGTGICIGMANIIPGVSGSTIAVVFNIYDKFINAITPNVKKLWKNRKFVFPLVLGMLIGVLLFSKLIEILYSNFKIQTNYFFTGLVIGSLPMIAGYMVKKFDVDSKKPEQKKSSRIASVVISIVAGLGVMILFHYLDGVFSGASKSIEDLPAITAGLEVKIFIAGILGAVAMIIPGISGSLMMLIMGVYPIVTSCIPALLENISSIGSTPWNFLHPLFLLLPNGIGVLIGLVAGAKLISILFKKVPNVTYAIIFGLLLGSVINVFPGFNAIQNLGQGAASVGCLLAGIAMAYFSSKMAPVEDSETDCKPEEKTDSEKQDKTSSRRLTGLAFILGAGMALVTPAFSFGQKQTAEEQSQIVEQDSINSIEEQGSTEETVSVESDSEETVNSSENTGAVN